MKKGRHRHPKVRRITVDERLAPDFIRLAVAHLEADTGDLIDDELDEWSEEDAEFVHSATVLEAFGLREADELLVTVASELVRQPAGNDPAGVFWNCLEEGQVFLAGEFEIRGGDRERPEAIVPRAGAREVLRIDRLPSVKAIHKARYTDVLSEGG